VTVNLTSPDYEIYLEARKEGGIAYDVRMPGPGGLPYGTQGSLAALLSAGIDSPVAAWLMMKRGVRVSLLHIDSGDYAGADCRKNVLRNLAALSEWTPGLVLPLTIINAQSFFDRLMADADPRYRCVLCKRGMIRLAELFASHRGAAGIITGDNLGQVATQTLRNMVTISSGVVMPVFRPLIGYDKEEIIAVARKIGTFSPAPGDTSCGVLPKKPATTSEQQAVEEMESLLQTDSMLRLLAKEGERIQALNGEIIS
jgi:thiamine biosynthesis protein ThiI